MPYRHGRHHTGVTVAGTMVCTMVVRWCVRWWYEGGTRVVRWCVRWWYEGGTRVVRWWYESGTRVVRGWYKGGVTHRHAAHCPDHECYQSRGEVVCPREQHRADGCDDPHHGGGLGQQPLPSSIHRGGDTAQGAQIFRNRVQPAPGHRRENRRFVNTIIIIILRE